MKYYVRDGRRFIKTEDFYGMYANRDGSFSTFKQSDSYGIVVIHNIKEIVIAHLEVKPSCTWEEAMRKYKLPSRLQLLAAFELKSMFDPNNYVFWTNEEHGKYLAWILYCDNGYIHDASKDYKRYVREFTTIKL